MSDFVDSATRNRLQALADELTKEPLMTLVADFCVLRNPEIFELILRKLVDLQKTPKNSERTS